jgi:hypothetical protein
MRRLRLLICTLAAVICTAAPAPASAQRPSRPGMVTFTAHGIPSSQPAARVAAYRSLRRAGVRAIRLDIVWAESERADGTFDFSRFDKEIELIRKGGLRVIGLLGYGHPRYSRVGGAVESGPMPGGLPPFGIGGAEMFPPEDPAPFARFARAAALHYGDEVVAWEVWNEENLGWRFWMPREDPAAYARLLCAASAALRAVDPATPVVFGGVFFPAVADLPHMSGPTFLERAYDAEPKLGRCYDALGYHPYAYPFTAPELDVPIRGSVLSAADQMRAVLRRRGDPRKPLWITEVGWPTHERAYGVSEEKHAHYVARMQAASFAQRIRVLNWYTYGDEADPSGGYNQEAHFGFFRVDGSPKPAYQALRTSWRLLGSSRFTRDRSRELGLPEGESMSGGRGFALEFETRRARVTAIWLAAERGSEEQSGLPKSSGSQTVSVPTRTRKLYLWDHLGKRQPVRPEAGRITIEAAPAPQYLVSPRARR